MESSHKKRRAYGTGGIFIKAGTWYISYNAGGKSIRESTKVKVSVTPGESQPVSPASVERLLQRRLAEVEDGELCASPLRVKVGSLLDDLGSEYKRRELSSLKPVTCHIEGKEYGLRKWFGHLKPKQVTRPFLVRASERWKACGLAQTTINRHLETLRRAFTLGVENKRIPATMVPDFPIETQANHDNARQTYVGVADMHSIIRQMPADVDDFVDWLYGSSQRWGEAAEMTWDMFRPATWEIVIPGLLTKNGNPRTLPVVAHLRPIIERRMEARKRRLAAGLPDCPYIFNRHGLKFTECWRNEWRKACKAAGFGNGTRATGITPHDLRHIAATDMRRAEIPESIIMQIGGWETASMFRRYAITDSEEIAHNLGKLSAYRKQQAKQTPKVVPIPIAAAAQA